MEFVAEVKEIVTECFDYLSYLVSLLRSLPLIVVDLFTRFSSFPFPIDFILLTFGVIAFVLICSFIAGLVYSIVTLFVGGDD